MSVHRCSLGNLSTKGVDGLLGGDGDFAGSLPDDLDPDTWAWLPGVDYAAGWRTAKAAADEVNTLLAACGVPSRALRAIADTDAAGRGVVRLEGIAAGWLRLEELLDLAAAETRRDSA